jgi:cephalosporin hydroxylase
MPEDFFPDRPWGKGNNPKTAVHAFLKECDRFEIDSEIDQKLLITTAPNGYLRCIKD